MKSTDVVDKQPQCVCQPTKPPFRWLQCIAKALAWRLCVLIMFVTALSTIWPGEEVLPVLAMCAPVLLPYVAAKTIVYVVHEWMWK